MNNFLRPIYFSFFDPFSSSTSDTGNPFGDSPDDAGVIPSNPFGDDTEESGGNPFGNEDSEEFDENNPFAS